MLHAIASTPDYVKLNIRVAAWLYYAARVHALNVRI